MSIVSTFSAGYLGSDGVFDAKYKLTDSAEADAVSSASCIAFCLQDLDKELKSESAGLVIEIAKQKHQYIQLIQYEVLDALSTDDISNRFESYLGELPESTPIEPVLYASEFLDHVHGLLEESQGRRVVVVEVTTSPIAEEDCNNE